MDIASFVGHFVYIAVTFGGGLAVGYLFKDKIEAALNKYFKRK
ncbi:MAG: hypothetical protein ACMG57_00215 [Candidatus Dojkabacteria bacterium]